LYNRFQQINQQFRTEIREKEALLTTAEREKNKINQKYLQLLDKSRVELPKPKP
jgi:hypothetical protein